jgi:hypothetical protein
MMTGQVISRVEVPGEAQWERCCQSAEPAIVRDVGQLDVGNDGRLLLLRPASSTVLVSQALY